MNTPRDSAGKVPARADRQRDAHDRRDAEVFALRRAQDAANKAKTERLRALRLAHEATLPKPEPKPAKRAKTAPQ